MLTPLWDTNDGTKFTLVIRRSRCTNLFGDQLFNRYDDRRYTGLFDSACQDSHRLMTETRCRYQKRGLYFVAVKAFRKSRSEFLRDANRIRGIAAYAPPAFVEASDYDVGFVFRQPLY